MNEIPKSSKITDVLGLNYFGYLERSGGGNNFDDRVKYTKRKLANLNTLVYR